MPIVRPAIYFDLDGVLVDFDHGKFRLMGSDFPDVNDSLTRLPETVRAAKLELYRAIAAEPTFYATLPLMPGARELWAAAEAIAGPQLGILTATPGFQGTADPARAVREAEAAKRASVAEHFGLTDPHRVIVTESHLKAGYVGHLNGSPQVLVDDRAQNCAEWTAAGGLALCHGLGPAALAHTLGQLRGLGRAVARGPSPGHDRKRRGERR